ncbi:MbtH family protein [Streptomyces sp. L2]|uniref:MbtH family protein n=1 Tax=Streptomyces sp. L2 TaxID=2162665 RepID=UPI0010112815|nr:MbtH family protein [Streptomyces sp. L2]
MFDDDERRFAVVRNDRAQHSIWPADRTAPAGWLETGFTGSRSDCLTHIAQVWTDLRPAPKERA